MTEPCRLVGVVPAEEPAPAEHQEETNESQHDEPKAERANLLVLLLDLVEEPFELAVGKRLVEGSYGLYLVVVGHATILTSPSALGGPLGCFSLPPAEEYRNGIR